MTQSSPETQRHDGFTPERQAAFLDALAASGSISAAAQAVGLSRTAIYNLRNREDEAGEAFRAAWDARLRQAVAVLAETAFDRAINGSRNRFSTRASRSARAFATMTVC